MKCCLPNKSKQWSSRHSLLSSFLHSTSLVCKRRRSVPRQVPSQFTKWRYLPMELCDIILRTNRVRCALNMEILDLLNKESVSGARSSRAQREVLLRMFEKVSRSLKYDSNIFFVHKHIYTRTPDPITLPRSHCTCGVTTRSIIKLDKNEYYFNSLEIKAFVPSLIFFCSSASILRFTLALSFALSSQALLSSALSKVFLL